MLTNIFRQSIVARATELWLKRAYDDDIFMDYLYQMEILVLCALPSFPVTIRVPAKGESET